MIQEISHTFNLLTTLQIVVCIIAFSLWLVRLVYLFLITGSVALKKSIKKAESADTPVSVLLTVRNEAENVKILLPEILGCGGQKFELIAVDDFSQDNTLPVLGMLKQRFGRLKISALSQETRYSEKLSQNIALKSAQYDWVLKLPVNMQNAGKDWLESFQQNSPENINVKIGYISIADTKDWYNKLFRVENFFQQLKSAGYTNNGMAFIYTENNVAFKREEYFRLGGFGQNIKEPYANLELIINSFIKKKNTELVFKPEAIASEKLKISRNEFIDFLKKSIRIEKHLNVWKQTILLIDRITEVLYFPAMLVVFLVVFGFWPIIALLFFLKLLAFMLIIKISQNRLKERKIFITSLMFSFVMPVYKLIFRWHFNRISRSQKWKNKG